MSKAQWNFHESPDRWNINQIVEHIAIWELLMTHEVSNTLGQGPLPDFEHYIPDSVFYNHTHSEEKRNALDSTKPFSFAIPLGINEGKNNLTWLMKMRNESIEFIKTDQRNLREYYICFGANIHQNYLMIIYHAERHLKQIRKVKEHPKYPK